MKPVLPTVCLATRIVRMDYVEWTLGRFIGLGCISVICVASSYMIRSVPVLS